MCIFTDINECSGGIHVCQDICLNIIGSYRCACSQSGYELDANGTNCQSKPYLCNRFYKNNFGVHLYDLFVIIIMLPMHGCHHSFCYIDIDECIEGISNCAQNCTDTDGSYTCSCTSGYQLARDGQQCDG